MKRTLSGIVIALSIILIACSGGGESAESIAKKWCDLKSKETKATTEEAKAAAAEKRKEYERTIEEKYKTDSTMREAVMREVEKCEDAAEGRE